ncbi:amidohydrolase family protein [Edwardsiella anguillarum]|nr:amidohydrolase family protein [Edwardsiella anguillarum]
MSDYPGFIDTHIHYPQSEMIGAYGEQLLEWLEKYTFPTEKSLPIRPMPNALRIFLSMNYSAMEPPPPWSLAPCTHSR